MPRRSVAVDRGQAGRGEEVAVDHCGHLALVIFALEKAEGIKRPLAGPLRREGPERVSAGE